MRFIKIDLAIIVTIMFAVACGSNTKIKDSTPIPDSATEKENSHYAVNESEKIDRTIRENAIGATYYTNDNGAELNINEDYDSIIYKRRFIIDFEINQYCYPEIRQLYEDHDLEAKFVSLKDNTKIKSSEILAVKNNEQQVVCWLNAKDQYGNFGWIYLGNGDPYENNNWAVIGSVEINGKVILLRKYTSWFSVRKDQPAYDRPSFEGEILWRAERTDDNSQINLEAICVTNDTFKGEYFPEHWVKVKDSYDRIGWMPGDKLDVERGGPKYLSPENRVDSSIYEP